MTQHSESALSLCLRYSKTSCEAPPQKKIHFPKLSTVTLVTQKKSFLETADNDEITIGQLITDQFDKATLEAFLTVQFTHHYEILRRSESINERLFYIRRVASEFWSVDKLKYNIRDNPRHPCAFRKLLYCNAWG